MLRQGFAAAFALLALAACTTAPVRPAGPAAPGSGPTSPPVTSTGTSTAVSFSDLAGWSQEDHLGALDAFRQGCGAAKDPALVEVCRKARAERASNDDDARRFLEANFRPEALPGQGLLTAYFAPEYEARMSRSAEFSAPMRGKPADLVTLDLAQFDPGLTGKKVAGEIEGGQVLPYRDRAAIEATPEPRPLAWLRPEDLFFLQIQGSGVLVLPDGRRVRAAFAAHNGRPFVGVATPMRDRGLLADNNTSGDAIRAWLASHRGPEADAIMRLNPRYVFFQTLPDDGRQAVGAAGVTLPPGGPSRWIRLGTRWASSSGWTPARPSWRAVFRPIAAWRWPWTSAGRSRATCGPTSTPARGRRPGPRPGACATTCVSTASSPKVDEGADVVKRPPRQDELRLWGMVTATVKAKSAQKAAGWTPKAQKSLVQPTSLQPMAPLLVDPKTIKPAGAKRPRGRWRASSPTASARSPASTRRSTPASTCTAWTRTAPGRCWRPSCAAPGRTATARPWWSPARASWAWASCGPARPNGWPTRPCATSSPACRRPTSGTAATGRCTWP